MRGNLILQGHEIYMHKGREAADFGNGLQTSALCQIVTTLDHGEGWDGRRHHRSKRPHKLYLHLVKLVMYCGVNRKNIFELKPRCREERAEPAAGLSKKQERVLWREMRGYSRISLNSPHK